MALNEIFTYIDIFFLFFQIYLCISNLGQSTSTLRHTGVVFEALFSQVP